MAATPHRPERIILHGKPFVRYLLQEDLQTRIQDLAEVLSGSYQGKQPVMLTTLTGAYRFAAALLPALQIPYSPDFVKVASYHDGMEAQTAPKLELDAHLDLNGRHVVVLEDIVETGATVELLRPHLLRRGAASVAVATLFYKAGKFCGQQPPDYVAFAIEDPFIVGFGLDYAQEGRHLNDVYQLEEAP